MTDMAQADRTLRSSSRPTPFTWADVKPKPSLTHGEICVIRRFNGSPEMLRVVDQHHYKEWVGCFSYIGERR
jgi:hypothetical protein